MNTLAIAIIVGILYPVYTWFANALIGCNDTRVQAAKKEFLREHPVTAFIGYIMALMIPAAYWIVVVVFMVL